MRSILDIFNDRTCVKFTDQKIERKVLEDIYNLMKLGPTSANSCPLRVVFVENPQEREKLYACLAPANIEKTKSAPVTAIFAYDTTFYNLLPQLFPQNPEIANYFASSKDVTIDTAIKNSSLQAAYFMMIARSFGIAVGPMAGFDADKINAVFFTNSGNKVNFICNLGYMDGEPIHARLPRLDFDICCKII